jgi:Domain of unknown function (DUF1707)
MAATGAEDPGNLPMSGLSHEQVLEALKVGFVQGRLTKDEFDLRVGQVLAAYTELDSLIADIPAGLTTFRPQESVPKSHNKKLIRRGTAAGVGASVLLTATVAAAARGNPLLSLVVVGLVGTVVAVVLAALLTLVSWILGSVAPRQPSPGAPPAADGKVPHSPGSAGSRPRISRDGWHTIEAVRHGLPKVKTIMPSRRAWQKSANQSILLPWH